MASPPLARRVADIALAVVVLLVVGMMIVPLPTALLDILITGNVAVAVLMLLVAMYITGGLQFASFPTVLLVTTLYRLALNVSSTRLILLQADAGDVISAFGRFVVRGNYVVGAIVFLILTLIQFLVIAKGSERVAEVGARFTLDAMPGKQMSIDAELRAGAISQDEARRRRSHLQRESQFYGAMDGAMKFVKGDAIAGIVITIVNIVGGLVIGVVMRDMDAGDALSTYGLLTIGDGLVSQIPALLISTSAGLVVTRVASDDEDGSLGADVAEQVFGNPKALRIGAAFLLVLAVIPGLPALPFSLIAIVFLFAAQRLAVAPAAPEPETVVAKEEAARETKARKQMVPLVVPVAIEVGEGLAESVAGAGGSGPLLEREVPALRDLLFLHLGIALPGVRARCTPHLAPQAFSISMQEVPVFEGRLPVGKRLALEAAPTLRSMGVDASPASPPFDEPGAWILEDQIEAVEAEGIPTLDEAAYIARCLEESLRRHAGQFVGLQEVQTMLDQLQRAYPALVRNVVPKPVPLALLADILRRLVDEGVSIRPLREILETLAIHAPNERDPVALTELVRAGLRRQITHAHCEGKNLPVFLVDPMIEDAVRDSIQHTAGGSYLAMPPADAKDIIEAVRRSTEGAGPPLLLVQADVRRYLRRLLEIELPKVTVLSFQELSPEANVHTLGQIRL